MNTLQELIKQHIKSNGYTIYSISKQSNINRTTLQKILSSQRKCTKEIYETLIQFFTLTTDEKEELDKAFLIEQIGYERFKTHMGIKSLLEMSASTLYQTDSQSLDIILPNAESFSDFKLLHGSYQIINTINSIILGCIKNKSNPFLYTFTDISQPFMPMLFKSLYHPDFADLEIKLLIELQKTQTYHESQNNIYNINVIMNLLPFFTSCLSSFTVNYYYCEGNNFKEQASIFPFYIITNTHIILLSYDFETAMLLSSESAHEYFILNYKKLLSKSNILTTGPQSPIEILNTLNTVNPSTNCPLCLNIQPTVEFFITPEMIDKYILNNPFKDMIREKLLERINQLDEEKHTIIFTLEGLQLFTAQGKNINFPDSIAMHFDINDRIYILTKLIESNFTEGDNHFLLLNPSKIHTSLNVSIAYTPPSLTYLLLVHKSGEPMFIPLQELTLCHSVMDFIQTLPEYGFVYSIEETNKILQEEINKLENASTLPSPPDSI